MQVFFIKNFSTLNLEKKSCHLDPEIDDLTPKKMPVYFFIYHPLAIFENSNFLTFSHEKQQTNLIFKHTHEDVPKCCTDCKIIKNPASGKLLTAIGLNNLIIEGRQVSLIPMIFFVLFFFSFCFFLQILYLILILKEKLHLILIVKMI